MANEENLKPMNKRTKSEQREIAKKGGKKRAENIQRKKRLREGMLELMSMEVIRKDYLKMLEKMHVEDKSNTMLLNVALFNKAVSGDVRAFREICELIDEDETGTTLDKLDEVLDKMIGEGSLEKRRTGD